MSHNGALGHATEEAGILADGMTADLRRIASGLATPACSHMPS
jgi:hypothetical protein